VWQLATLCDNVFSRQSLVVNWVLQLLVIAFMVMYVKSPVNVFMVMELACGIYMQLLCFGSQRLNILQFFLEIDGL
jgi:hypothetical protein